MKRFIAICASISLVAAIGCKKKEEEEETTTTTTTTTLPATFATGQAASFVLGQTTMTGNGNNNSDTEMNVPSAVTMTSGGAIYVAEQNNNRALGFAAAPTSNGEAGTVVIGQSSFTGFGTGTTADAMAGPQGISSYGSQLFVADTSNHRVLIYNSLSTGVSASFAVGQANPASAVDPAGGVQATTLRYPYAVWVAAGKMVIADTNYNRVLLYNSIPTASGAAASVAIGQADKTSSASAANKMSSPRAVWTDGTKILVADTNNHRVLIWNSWPATDGTAPDLVLGQTTVTGNTSNSGGLSDSSLATPEGVTSDGTQVFVSDSGNHRILYWPTWPTANKQAATMVFGQSDFTSNTAGATATRVDSPRRLYYDSATSTLYVADASNNRVLLFKKQ